MDDERGQLGMPILARQDVPVKHDPAGRPPVPQRVPEMHPTPLHGAIEGPSVVVLICGMLAITAFDLGQPLSAPIIRIPALIGSAVLLLVTADAAVRIARSVQAWWPIDHGRAVFRVAWVGVLLLGLGLESTVVWLVLAA